MINKKMKTESEQWIMKNKKLEIKIEIERQNIKNQNQKSQNEKKITKNN